MSKVRPKRPVAAHIVITANSTWNVWHFRRPIVHRLILDGYKVTVIAPRDEYYRNLVDIGCNFVPISMDRKGLNPARDALLTIRFWRIFRRVRPDAILSFTIKNNTFGSIAAKLLKIPIAPNVTGLGTAFLSGGVVEAIAVQIYRFAFRDLRFVFFQNTDDLDLFVDRKLVRKCQGWLLPGSGIDLAYFAPAAFPSDGNQPVFLMVCRLLRDKGVLEFVEAAAIVRRRYPSARFQLMGATGADNRTAFDMGAVESWRRDNGIEYLGECEDVRPYIEAAHCVVLPSYREGAPRALIEAAAMARPVVATDVAGCRAVVTHQVTGLLCEPRSAESLATACLAFLGQSHEQQAAMGRAGRAKMEGEFDEAIVVKAYRDIVAEMVV